MTKLFIPTAIIILAASLLSFQEKQKFDLKASIERGRELYSIH